MSKSDRHTLTTRFRTTPSPASSESPVTDICAFPALVNLIGKTTVTESCAGIVIYRTGPAAMLSFPTIISSYHSLSFNVNVTCKSFAWKLTTANDRSKYNALEKYTQTTEYRSSWKQLSSCWESLREPWWEAGWGRWKSCGKPWSEKVNTVNIRIGLQ